MSLIDSWDRSSLNLWTCTEAINFTVLRSAYSCLNNSCGSSAIATAAYDAATTAAAAAAAAATAAAAAAATTDAAGSATAEPKPTSSTGRMKTPS